MAMKKKVAAPKKTEPKPPTPRQSAMTSTKSPAKKSSSAAGDMGKKVGAKVAKETSAKTREMANAYKKSGASYLSKTKDTYYDLIESPRARSQRNDLSGSGRAKFDPYGFVSFTGGRTSQRFKDQEKRKKKK